MMHTLAGHSDPSRQNILTVEGVKTGRPVASTGSPVDSSLRSMTEVASSSGCMHATDWWAQITSCELL
eukprot:8746419-Pyramimonas_sp.AAC.1